MSQMEILCCFDMASVAFANSDTISLVKLETEICLQLAKEDGDLIKYGNAEMLHPSVSPSVFIYQGLEIEDAQ
jgi:hypothetical protein